MSAPVKLAAFAAALALLLGGGALAGAALGPDREGSEPPEMAGHEESGDEAMDGMDGGAHPVRGLAAAQDGLRLELATPELHRGRTERLAFTIVGDDGRAVEDFAVTHTKRMHLIVVRRDMTGFQHLHPTQGPGGTWTTPLRLDDAGSYRVFADFEHDGEPQTLATDLRVDGPADLQPLPPVAERASTDGYDVRLASSDARPGEEADLRFEIARDGRPVHTEPYLGAGGHLVALREGDLAFLHVHPTEHAEGEDEGDEIGFEATFPTEGRYRLFLQFKAGGQVHTAAFTEEVRR